MKAQTMNQTSFTLDLKLTLPKHLMRVKITVGDCKCSMCTVYIITLDPCVH